MGPVIEVTNELLDIFYRECAQMGVRGAIEAIFARVNEQIAEETVHITAGKVKAEFDEHDVPVDIMLRHGDSFTLGNHWVIVR
jgi:hypothetical protein